jgi:hypothetical protein
MIDSAQLHRLIVQATDTEQPNVASTYMIHREDMLKLVRLIQRESFELVGYFYHHPNSGYQQTTYASLDEWAEDQRNYAECDRSDTPPTALYRMAEEIGK